MQFCKKKLKLFSVLFLDYGQKIFYRWTKFLFPILLILLFLQDFKFRSVLCSVFRRKKSFTSFRTSMRSSFGSTRYRSRFHSRANGSSLYNQHSTSNSDQARTVDTSLKDSLMESSTSRNFIGENGASGGKLKCDIQNCAGDTVTHV